MHNTSDEGQQRTMVMWYMHQIYQKRFVEHPPLVVLSTESSPALEDRAVPGVLGFVELHHLPIKKRRWAWKVQQETISHIGNCEDIISEQLKSIIHEKALQSTSHKTRSGERNGRITTPLEPKHSPSSYNFLSPIPSYATRLLSFLRAVSSGRFDTNPILSI